MYLRDTGTLHHLLGIEDEKELFGHPILGASWEGFVIEQIAQQLKPQHELFFYRTHQGAEIDLLITKAGKPRAAIEIKFGDRVSLSRGNYEAVQSLNVGTRFVITQHGQRFPLNNDFEVLPLKEFLKNELGQL